MATSSTRDGNTKGGSLESGTSHKDNFHGTSPSQLGMDTADGKGALGSQKPEGNPATKVGGFTIK